MQQISKEDIFKEIKLLAEARAPSGLEEERAKVWEEQMKKHIPNATIIKQKQGNVIFKIASEKEGDVKKVAIIGHLDEIGGTVRKIDDSGLILFQPRGGIEPRWLISRKVRILTLVGTWIRGVILGRTIHATPISKRNNSAVNFNELFIFTGIRNKRLLKEFGVHVGAPIVFEGYTEYLNGDYGSNIIVSNSLDNIISLVLMEELAARFANGNPFPVEIYFVATTREEIGREGAIIFAKEFQPDYVIAIDFGIVGTGRDQIDCGARLYGGPIITWVEESGKGVLDYKLGKSFVKTAEYYELYYQHGVFQYYGSDAGIIQKNFGIPSILIAIPMLTGHNIPEIMSIEEIYKGADLIHKWFSYFFK